MNSHLYYKTVLLFILLIISVIPKLSYPINKQATNEKITVSGKVVDENNNPVLATISVKGTSIATGTNEKGEFELKNIESNAILIVSGINIEVLEIPVQGRSSLGTLVAKLKIVDNKEVIVEANTGYQTLKPNELNGSIETINNKTLNQQVGTNILKRLDGVTSGLLFTNKQNNNPQSDLNISIRGLSTINGPLNPVIVLDNFIYEGDINNINPNDIESVSVLKDAAATSIYGARGGNGVIVITSKKGKLNQAIKVDFNSTVIIGEKPNLFYPSQISSSDYIDVEQFLYRNDYYADQINFDWYYHTPFTPALQIFIAKQNGLINETDSINQINKLKSIDSRNEYKKYLYTNDVTQQYAINVRGGSNTNVYSFAFNYDNNRSSLYEQRNKLNIHIHNIYKPHKNIQIILGAYYTNNRENSGRPGSVTLGSKNVPYIQLTNDQGDATSIPQNFGNNFTDTVGQGKLLNWKYYPLEDYKHDRIATSLEEIVANIGLSYKIIAGLEMDVRYQYQRQNRNTERNAGIESFYARDLINRFSQIDNTLGTINYIVPNDGIQTRYYDIGNSQNFRAQLNFNRQWNNHTVNAIAGTEVREISSKGYNSTIYGYNSDPLISANVDLVNQYPVLPYGDLSTIPGAPYLSNTNNRFVSIYANAAYSFRNRYSIYGSMRRDGANIFGVATNDKWKPLWSVGTAWEISKENFYKLNLITHLKIRASYGYSGNIDVSRSALPIASYNTNITTNLPYTRIQTLSNPQLQWEESRQTNLAIEFATKNNMISGTIEFYKKKGTNLYGLTDYDYTTWGLRQQITKNIASMSGRGLDIRIESSNINKTFKWTTLLLFNYNQNKVTEYFTPEAAKGSDLIGSSGVSITPAIGKPLYSIAAYRWEGLNNQGDPQGLLNGQKTTDYQSIISSVSHKGIKNNESVVFIGSATPIVFGSLINTFSWKKLSASINISYKSGYYFKKSSLSYANLFEMGIGTNDFSKRWQKPGDENITNVPSLVYTNYPQFSYREAFYGASEINILKGDHIRLQYINLSYSFKETSQNSKVGIRIYANISNMGIIWRANKDKIDPDFPSSIPIPRSYAIGLQVTF